MKTKSLCRLVGAVLVVAVTLVLARPGLAFHGIYCSSYQYIDRGPDMVCVIECVYCENEAGEVVGEDCREKSCWFREV